MFFDDTGQQIEKKMLLLEGIALLRHPTHELLRELMLREGRMNYFEFSHCLTELLDSGLAKEVDANRYELTQRGENAIHYFSNRLDASAIAALKSTVETLSTPGPSFTAIWEENQDGRFLKLIHPTRGLCLVLRVDDEAAGAAIVKAWSEQDPQALGQLILQLSDRFLEPSQP